MASGRQKAREVNVKVKEIMTTRVVTVTADTPVPVIASLLRGTGSAVSPWSVPTAPS